MAEQEASAVLGGGGTAEQSSAVTGGGGIAEHEASAVTGGGGIAEHEVSAVTGGGGIAEQDSSIFGGGIFDPERTGLSAPAHTCCPASGNPSPSSSPDSDHAPDSIQPMVLRQSRPVNPRALMPEATAALIRLPSAEPGSYPRPDPRNGIVR